MNIGQWYTLGTLFSEDLQQHLQELRAHPLDGKRSAIERGSVLAQQIDHIIMLGSTPTIDTSLGSLQFSLNTVIDIENTSSYACPLGRPGALDIADIIVQSAHKDAKFNAIRRKESGIINEIPKQESAENPLHERTKLVTGNYAEAVFTLADATPSALQGRAAAMYLELRTPMQEFRSNAAIDRLGDETYLHYVDWQEKGQQMLKKLCLPTVYEKLRSVEIRFAK